VTIRSKQRKKQQQDIKMSKMSEKGAFPQRIFLDLIILSQKREKQE